MTAQPALLSLAAALTSISPVGALTHSDRDNICKLYEVGEVEGQPYIVMQLIHGSSLLGVQQLMSREEKVLAVQKVCGALQAAHNKNMIHRDIKPGSIMVERRPDGTWWPYLMDFGPVKEVNSNSQSSTGGIEGTPAYMAPEQARGENRALDLRADVYGLRADWEAAQDRPVTALLEAALAKGLLATQSPQNYPDAWQTLAETHLRLAQAQKEPKLRNSQVAQGLESLTRVFATNPNHAQGWPPKVRCCSCARRAPAIPRRARQRARPRRSHLNARCSATHS